MRLSTASVFIIAGIGTMSLVACGGASQPLPSGSSAAAPSRGWMSPTAKQHGAKVYVADLVRNVVRIYGPGGGNEIGEITNGIDGPYGMWVVPGGSLYVSNVTSGTVTVYPDGENSPSQTLGGATDVIGVAVSKSGDVYAAGSNAVYYYGKGATSPTRTVSLPEPEGFGIDAKQNVYCRV